ncbi:hypothetical protein D3C81_2047620 [compost metagenome]
MVLGADIHLVFTGDSGLLFDPVGLARGLAVADRTTDTGTRANRSGHADIEFFALNLSGVGH